jgi:hypothetical protein
MTDWDEVVAFTCSLPEVVMGPYYRDIVPTINGKGLVGQSREGDSFGLRTSSIEEKQMLIETDPDTFWETPHYANFPAVLVRYGSDAEADERIKLYIRRAWWDRLKKKQRQAYGERP